MAFVEPGLNISKGPFCYYLDELSKRDDSVDKLTKLLKAIAGLKKNGYRGLASVFEKCVFNHFKELYQAQKKAIAQYLDSKWFNPKDGWWPHLKPVELTLCIGLIKALEESLKGATGSKKNPRALPIDSYWIIINDSFETSIALSSSHVSAFIMTPPPKPSALGVWSATKTPLWVVMNANLGGYVEAQTEWQRKASPRSQKIESSGRVLTVRVKGPGQNG